MLGAIVWTCGVGSQRQGEPSVKRPDMSAARAEPKMER